MAEKQRILIVDDDGNIAELISLYLLKECFDTCIAEDGEDALRKFAEYHPNLILLDIMLPGIDGYEVCRQVRRTSQVPIIMLSAKGETFDKVLGLELGADDYMIKPFDSKELVARVRAVLRRQTAANEAAAAAAAVSAAQGGNSSGSGNMEAGALASTTEAGGAARQDEDNMVVRYEGLKVSLGDYTVEYLGEIVEMPPKELELLYYLASNPNRVFKREQLLDKIWGYEYIGDTRTVDVHIKRLREKIKDHANWSIGTVWGIGYKFSVGK